MVQQQGGYENVKGERTESNVGMLKIGRRLLIEAEKCCGSVSFFCSSVVYQFLFKKHLQIVANVRSSQFGALQRKLCCRRT